MDVVEINWLASTTDVPAWAHVMICVYFDLFPAPATQQSYRDRGLSWYHYLYSELTRHILGATWEKTPELLGLPYAGTYLDDAYPGPGPISVRETLTAQDRRDLARAFAAQLGVPWATFPYSYQDLGL